MAFVYRTEKSSLFLDKLPSKQCFPLSQMSTFNVDEENQEVIHALKNINCQKKFKRPNRIKEEVKNYQAVLTVEGVLGGRQSHKHRLVGLRKRTKELRKRQKQAIEFTKQVALKESATIPFDSNEKENKRYQQKQIQKPSLSAVFKSKTQNVGFTQINNNPGPGNYEIDKKTSKLMPKKSTPETHSNLTAVLKSDTYEESRRQKLFPVKYQQMNSSCFKQSPKLLQYSNKQLMNKLLRNRSEGAEKNQDQEYFEIEQKLPGPTSYSVQNLNRASNCSNTSFLSNSIRFPTLNGSPIITYLKGEKSVPDIDKESFFFTSEVNRFDTSPALNQKLQYASTIDSHIKDTRNRKLNNHPFQSGGVRIDSVKQDTIPYYKSHQPFANPVLGSWSFNTDKKGIHYKHDNNPGVGEYDIRQKAQNKQPEFFCPELNKQMIRDDKEIKKQFYIATYECREEPKRVHSSKNSSFRLKFKGEEKKKKGKLETIPEKYLDTVYDVPQIWEIKSFNRLFTTDLLKTNNPIQNKMM